MPKASTNGAGTAKHKATNKREYCLGETTMMLHRAYNYHLKLQQTAFVAKKNLAGVARLANGAQLLPPAAESAVPEGSVHAV